MLAGLVQTVPLSERFFTVDDSIRLVGIVVIGGLGTIIGPVLGALWIEGLPSLFDDSSVVALFTSSIGLLLVVMYFPGGFVQILYSWRSSALRWAENHYGLSTPPKRDRSPVRLPTSHRVRADTGHAVLETDDLSVAFGGNQALNGASLSIPHNRIVGLIGTNGAGKSTFMNAVGGFVSAGGCVRLNGTEISRLAPHRRARLGLGRTFQGATLFPELTVRETVQVALEARERTPILATATGLPPSNRISRAQREAEAFGPLLVSINRELHSSMLIIEHDMLTNDRLTDQSSTFQLRLAEYPEESRDVLLALGLAKSDFIELALDIIDRDFGGIDRYARNRLSLTQAEIDALRKLLLHP